MADPCEATNPDNPAEATAASARLLFISYASNDADVAQKMCSALEAAGSPCWMAPRDVRPGAQYADAIVGAINEATSVVLVLSANSIASSHVGREVERAASKHKQIISFRIDAAPLSRALEYFLGESQWIDVAALGMPAALAKLAQAVKQGPATTVVPLPLITRGDDVKKRLAIAATLVLCIGVAGFLGRQFWSLNHRVAERATAVPERSIAVLPFVDMSEKKDQEYFGDGMAEEILDLLAKVPGLTVIGRTSSFQFKGKNEDLRSIGTKLNAAYVLEGSVRRAGDQVRITAQLINTRTGTHAWSETYDRQIGDVLKLQDAIAAAIVREMQLTVATTLIPRSTPVTADVYDLMLRARHASDRIDNEGADEAVTLYQQALDQDSRSADAAAGLANAYAAQVQGGSVPAAVGFERARRLAKSGLELDPKNVMAHVVLADIHMYYDWDWAAAEREIQQAAAVAPHSADVLTEQAWISETVGRRDDAFKEIQAALAQDPMNPQALQNLATIQESRSHLPEAEAAMRRALDIRPAYSYGHYLLGIILLARGDPNAALLEMQQETQDDGKRQGLAIVYYALERKVDADSVLAEMLKKDSRGNAYGIAEVYGFRGQTDEAMNWLERAYAQKDAYLYTIGRDQLLEKLEGDPRFEAFLRKMNLSE